MVTGLRDWVEIFRAGDYGGKGRISASDLDAIVSDYNPAWHEAPAVIGHPEQDAPAYGWVEALKREGNTLLAKFKQLAPAFVEALREGRFKKRSVAFYRKAGGKLSLRHVGFLGATPPEVKGLADCSFSEHRLETIEFIEGPAVRFTECHGAKASPESIEIAQAAGRISRERGISFGEALTAVYAERRDCRAIEFREDVRLKASPESIELARAASRLVRDVGLSFGEALTAIRESTITFTESPGISVAAESIALTKAAQRIVRARGISFGEALAQVREIEFTECHGIAPSRESIELAEAAQRMVRDRGISFVEALSAVRAERVEEVSEF